MNTTREQAGRLQQWMRQLMVLGLAVGGCGAASVAGAASPMLRPAKTAVDSRNYEYYDGDVLCDGVREPLRWTEGWKSTDLASAAHWAELDFTSAVPVQTVAIFWDVERGGAVDCSRAYAIQAWVNGAFTNVLEVKDNPEAPRSIHTLKEPVTSTKFRIWQPAGGGSTARKNALCIAEIELYSIAKRAAEFGTPEDLAALRKHQAEVRDNTIGLYRRTRYYRGRTGSVAPTLRKTGMRVIQLDYLDARELELCRIAVLCGARGIPDPAALEAYVRNGGCLVAIHNGCGRALGSAIPDVWSFAGMSATNGSFTVANAKHPILAGITNAVTTTYGDYAVLKAGRKGTALVRDAKGRDVIVAGSFGAGKALAIGTFPGMASGGEGKMVTPTAAEQVILTNAVRWLKHDTAWRDSDKPWYVKSAKPAKGVQFENVTDACGMYYWGYSKNVAIADVDGDGLQDIFSTQSKISSIDACDNLLYKNEGNWKFTEIGVPAGVGIPHGIGSAFGDVNNDGKMDLFVAWMPEMAGKEEVGALFMGDGAFHFKNVTQEAGLGDLGKVSVCALADYDNDGWLDIYVAGCGQENRIYRNLGNGKFENVTTAVGLAEIGAKGEAGYGGNMGTTFGDLDGDGFDDLVAFAKNVMHIFRNEGGKRFVEATDYLGAGKPILAAGTLGVTLGDYDNDGDLDLYVAGANRLFRNDGKFKFTDVTKAAGLDVWEKANGAYGPAFVDWNNDGHLDLFVGSGGCDNTTFQNNGDGTFKDVSCQIGLDAFAVHGFNFGDLDNDGDLDYFSTAWSKHPCVLLKNTIDDGNALTIRVKGARTNRSGVGARLWVYEEKSGKKTGQLQGYREVRSGGGSMYSGEIVQQHVGVARGKTYTVEALFPVTGKRVTLTGVAAAQTLVIEEPGDAVAVK